MQSDWIKSPSGRRVLVHWADPRPAWLWSGDGAALIWRNRAARLFGAKLKKSGIKLLPDAAPIKGQVARVMRMGSPGRSSLSRVQFLAGDRPISTTCTCTPLEVPGDHAVLLIVGVDPVAPELLEQALPRDEAVAGFLPPGTGYLLIDEDGHVAEGSEGAIEHAAPIHAEGGLPQGESGVSAVAQVAGRNVTVTPLKASQHEATLVLLEGIEAIPEPVVAAPAVEDEWPDQPMLPGIPFVEPGPGAEPEPDGAADHEADWVAPHDVPEPRSTALSSLFDRLANDAELYAGLEPAAVDEPKAEEPVDTIGALIDFDEPEEAEPVAAAPVAEVPTIVEEPVADHAVMAADAAVETAQEQVLYRVVGRGFEQASVPAGPPAIVDDLPPATDGEPEIAPIPDLETVERVSRYNFDELSRILTDRVAETPPVPVVRPPAPVQPEGQLVSLNGETLILNRLPLGILVFRDQQVLFANRAITEMTGYGSVEELRAAGLGAIFPAAGEQESGPVNHLVQRNGTLLPVTARLQSISWQGRPALMLSASATEVRTGHETAVRHFTEYFADQRHEGFIELTRAGVVSAASARAMQMFGRTEPQVMGKPLSGLIEPGETRTLQEFLERPARFAETARPVITLRGVEPGTEILLFAQGQAGVITGYFGLVRKSEGPAALTAPATTPEIEPALLGRLSRGVRRPLNTIIGFADLIRSAAFGAVGNERYAEYARDIRTAGHEIAALVNELDDYARLRDGRHAPRLTEIDLKALLETCATRVRAQANAVRVLVRSAISERLPNVKADRASLGQAVLNLLASAIDQTPTGGSVILSSQENDEGAVVINVRDSGMPEADPAERFVVFRDGESPQGEALAPMRSSVGLALTRSLAAVNSCTLSIDPAGSSGTLFSLTIPPDAVIRPKAAAAD